MSRVKQAIKIIVMFVVLFMIVGAPLAYMKYQNRHMLNEVRLSSTQPQQTDNKGETVQNYNIWERIGIINQSVRVSSPLLSAFKNESITNQAIGEIIKTMEKQLAMLREYRALPELTYSEVLQISISKETYIYQTDALHSDLSISVWAIDAEYEDFYVCAYMDTKISALYDVTIQMKDSGLVYENQISKNGFLEYLQTFSPLPDVKEREEVYAVNDAYTAKEIVLRLYSVNTKTNKFTIYSFNDKNKFTDNTPHSYITDSSQSSSGESDSSISDDGK